MDGQVCFVRQEWTLLCPLGRFWYNICLAGVVTAIEKNGLLTAPALYGEDGDNMKAEEAKYNPKCPYCEMEIETIGLHLGEPATFLGVQWRNATLAVFSCPHCQKVLGTAHQGRGESTQ
ncbi:MAG: hypothetical protein R3C10_23305 [Pirellulales bacterium]